jgi:hypothetical protein
MTGIMLFYWKQKRGTEQFLVMRVIATRHWLFSGGFAKTYLTGLINVYRKTKEIPMFSAVDKKSEVNFKLTESIYLFKFSNVLLDLGNIGGRKYRD